MKIEFEVIFVGDDVLVDYDGMNYPAAKALKYTSYKLKPNQVLVNIDTQGKKEIIATIVHECVEAYHMHHGFIYWQAHQLAAQAEKDKDKLAAVATFINPLFPKKSGYFSVDEK